MPTQALMVEMGLTAQAIARRLQVVGMRPADLERIATVQDMVVRHVDELVDSFFDCLRGLTEARRLVAPHALIDRARRLKRDHISAMVGGDYGAAYTEQRLELALVYSKIGLDSGVFLGAFHHLLARVGTMIMSHASAQPVDGFEIFASLMKVAFYDVTLITDVLVFERERTIRQQQAAIRRHGVELEARNERLQEATRMKSEFLANMSHELRTPLNAIIGLSRLLHDGRVAAVAKQQEFLGDILSSGKHLLQLINDVLDLSKVESGKMEFRPELIDLVRVITEVTSILRTTAATKQIHIDSSVATDLGEVFLDAARFKQVLYNYLSNALKFTPEAGKVSLRVEREGPEHLRLVVADTGIGISKADQAKLFVEFQQLEAGASKQYGGTGLGLALTKRLVEAQGGSVGVTSEPAVGSQFYAVLACRRASVAPSAAPTLKLQPGRIDGPVVLVVEDDPRDLQLIANALGDAGCRIEVASNGAIAVAMAREKDYAAITLDLILPDMTGLEVLGIIQAETKNKHVPIVVITVVTERATGGFAVTDVLAKPLDRDALLQTMRRTGVLAPLSTVLVVDDDPIALKLMAETLERLHYRSACYTDGEAALRDLVALAPTAVILDLLMPGLDGFEFLARLRESVAHRDLPVLVWTTKDLAPHELVWLRATAQAVLQKGAAELVDELRDHLGRRAPDGA